MKTLFNLIIILFSLTACQKEFTHDECEDLSMQKFIGNPRASNQFDNNCKKYKIKYTQVVCQTAFNQLTMGTSEEELKKSFGKKIMGCFTSSDLKRFLK